jgi:hypothetical protein
MSAGRDVGPSPRRLDKLATWPRKPGPLEKIRAEPHQDQQLCVRLDSFADYLQALVLDGQLEYRPDDIPIL